MGRPERHPVIKQRHKKEEATMTCWVYIQSETSLWTVGFFSPDGQWHGDSDHDSRESAAERVHYLNGGERS